MILGVSRLAIMRAIVLARHSPKRNVGVDELVVRLYLSLVNRPIVLAPKGSFDSKEFYRISGGLKLLGFFSMLVL